MQNINIDDGFSEFSLNNDESRIVRINLNDFGIITRMKEKQAELEDYAKEQVKIESPEDLIEYKKRQDKITREMTDYIFNSDVSSALYGNQDALTLKNGVTILERFFKAIEPMIKKTIETEAKKSKERVEKYTKDKILSQVKK